MSTKPLSDDEASKEMKKMVAFIMQEAEEKCRELCIRADEEFNIEKAKLVRQETETIEQQFQKKLKQAEVKRRIGQSVQINKSRLQVLEARDRVLDEVREEVRNRLLPLSIQDSGNYRQLLERLILQSLFRLMDSKVSIRCRGSDREFVEQAMGRVREAFKEATGILVAITIDDKAPLSSNCAGGVIVSSHSNRIVCDNTLETRLEHAFDRMLPAIRVRLFGAAPNRKFFD